MYIDIDPQTRVKKEIDRIDADRVNSEPKVKSEPKVEPEIEPEDIHKSESRIETESPQKLENITENKFETDANIETEIQSEPESIAEPETGTDIRPEPESVSDPTVETVSTGTIESGYKSGDDMPMWVESASDPESESKIESANESISQTDSADLILESTQANSENSNNKDTLQDAVAENILSTNKSELTKNKKPLIPPEALEQNLESLKKAVVNYRETFADAKVKGEEIKEKYGPEVYNQLYDFLSFKITPNRYVDIVLKILIGLTIVVMVIILIMVLIQVVDLLI